jgi:fido (protein-threonine AMPylation protein)
VWSILEFALPKSGPWHKHLKLKDIKNIDIMIQDISQFQIQWDSLKKEQYKKQLEKIQEEMLINFILHLNKGEGIGTKDQASTQRALRKYKQLDKTKVISTQEMESINIYKAWNKLVILINKDKKDEAKNRGLLDIDWVKQLHIILMTGIIDNNINTAPGLFSISPRFTCYKGKEHKYPHFKNEKEWFDALQPILDHYNALVEGLKAKLITPSSRIEGITKLFKLAAWLLHSVISLHPFSDGNGRLCRLLASYVLTLICPFPSPIENISTNTDFLDAIIKGRDSKTAQGQANLGDLTALIIESTWKAYQTFWERLKIN